MHEGIKFRGRGTRGNMPRRRHIEGLEAARLANEKRDPVRLLPSQSGEKQLDKTIIADEAVKTAPPRVGKLGHRGDMIPAPKAELQVHKAAFREVFGQTLSDEFVDEMLTQLVTVLAPGPWDTLEPATLNAAIALIASVKPQTELEALLAVQIAATGFASLKFLKLGQRHLEDAYIDVYGGYGTRLLRLQLELIQALDKHRRGRRGNKQTVEVRHVHIHPGCQGVVGIINSRKDGSSGGETMSTALAISPGSESQPNAKQIAHAPQPAMRSPNEEPELVPSARDAERPMSDARGSVPGSTEGE
jgi:hypothetical protein